MKRAILKMVSVIANVIVLSGCFTYLIGPITFVPMLVLVGVILVNEGRVATAVVWIWRFLTAVTFLQIIAVLWQPGALFVVSKLENKKKGRIYIKKPPFRWTSPLVFAGVLLHLLVALGVVWIYLPWVRGEALVQGAQWQLYLLIPFTLLTSVILLAALIK